ncbi:MAG: sigma-70 family RNA polymerase sigma factor [Alphaproteobacteria bacterium]
MAGRSFYSPRRFSARIAPDVEILSRAEEFRLGERMENGRKKIVVALLEIPSPFETIRAAYDAAAGQSPSAVFVQDGMDEKSADPANEGEADAERPMQNNGQPENIDIGVFRRIAELMGHHARDLNRRLEAGAGGKFPDETEEKKFQERKSEIVDLVNDARPPDLWLGNLVMRLAETKAGEPLHVQHAIGEAQEGARDLRKAQEELVEANMRLVVSWALKRVGRSRLELEDLVQEGNMGLMKAAGKFDHRLGTKFSTYATWWLRQNMGRADIEQGHMIRTPVHLFESARQVNRAASQLREEFGREATPEELAMKTGASLKKIETVLNLAKDPISLETPTGTDQDKRLGDSVVDQTTPTPSQHVISTELKERLAAALISLTSKEERVLRMRFGMGPDDDDEMTLQEVGDKFDLTRERIRQIEAKALRKLREQAKALGLKDYEETRPSESITKTRESTKILQDTPFFANEVPELLEALAKKEIDTKPKLANALLKSGFIKDIMIAHGAIYTMSNGKVLNQHTGSLFAVARHVAAIAEMPVEAAYARQIAAFKQAQDNKAVGRQKEIAADVDLNTLPFFTEKVPEVLDGLARQGILTSHALAEKLTGHQNISLPAAHASIERFAAGRIYQAKKSRLTSTASAIITIAGIDPNTVLARLKDEPEPIALPEAAPGKNKTGNAPKPFRMHVSKPADPGAFVPSADDFEQAIAMRAQTQAARAEARAQAEAARKEAKVREKAARKEARNSSGTAQKRGRQGHSAPLQSAVFFRDKQELLAALKAKGIDTRPKLVETMVAAGFYKNAKSAAVNIHRMLQDEIVSTRTSPVNLIAAHIAEIAGIPVETAYAKQIAAYETRIIKLTNNNPRRAHKTRHQDRPLQAMPFFSENPELCNALTERGIEMDSQLARILGGMTPQGTIYDASAALRGLYENGPLRRKNKAARAHVSVVAARVAEIAGMPVEAAYARQIAAFKAIKGNQPTIIGAKERPSHLLAETKFFAGNLELLAALQEKGIDTRSKLTGALTAAGFYKNARSALICIDSTLKTGIIDGRNSPVSPAAAHIAAIAGISLEVAYASQIAAHDAAKAKQSPETGKQKEKPSMSEKATGAEDGRSQPLREIPFFANAPELLEGLQKNTASTKADLISILVESELYPNVETVRPLLDGLLAGHVISRTLSSPTLIACHVAGIADITPEVAYARQIAAFEGGEIAPVKKEKIKKERIKKEKIKKEKKETIRVSAASSPSLSDNVFLAQKRPDLLAALQQRGIHTEYALAEKFSPKGIKHDTAINAVRICTQELMKLQTRPAAYPAAILAMIEDIAGVSRVSMPAAKNDAPPPSPASPSGIPQKLWKATPREMEALVASRTLDSSRITQPAEILSSHERKRAEREASAEKEKAKAGARAEHEAAKALAQAARAEAKAKIKAEHEAAKAQKQMAREETRAARAEIAAREKAARKEAQAKIKAGRETAKAQENELRKEAKEKDRTAQAEALMLVKAARAEAKAKIKAEREAAKAQEKAARQEARTARRMEKEAAKRHRTRRSSRRLADMAFFKEAPALLEGLERQGIRTQSELSKAAISRGVYKDIDSAAPIICALYRTGPVKKRSVALSFYNAASNIAAMAGIAPEIAYASYIAKRPAALPPKTPPLKNKPQPQSQPKPKNESAPGPKVGRTKPLTDIPFFKKAAAELTIRLANKGIRTQKDLTDAMVAHGYSKNLNSAGAILSAFFSAKKDMMAKPYLPMTALHIAAIAGLSPQEAYGAAAVSLAKNGNGKKNESGNGGHDNGKEEAPRRPDRMAGRKPQIKTLVR